MRLIDKFLLVFLLLLISGNIMAASKMDRLLKERSLLYKDYEFYQKQESSFWGTQSKKDLKKIINTLRKIIVKDTEIIKEINIQNNQKTVKVVTKTIATQDWSLELENEKNKLELLLRKVTFDYNVLKDELESLESADSRNNTILFFLLIIISGLTIYIVRLRQILKSQKTSNLLA